MPVQPPFLYDDVRTQKPFDPRAASRASLQPKPQRPKQEGPLISFNQHPDSYLILPYGNSSGKTMSPNTKTIVIWLRFVQMGLRSLELLSAIALLVFMILIRGMDNTTGWIMRITPGVAILHTVYGVYHLCRKPSGRTPASSASYMLFASFFDVSIVPFYAFSALVAKTRQEGWKTILPDQGLMPVFSIAVFYLAAVGAGLHFVSLVLSVYLAATFRKITKLPPDCNPLESHLTSRHKKNKSSMSTVTTMSEKRLSTPLESKRASGNAYEDLGRPPTIPFFHTRTQSTDSFSTYRSTPPPSRDARNDLPSRQYGVQPGNSARSSVTDLKRASYYNGQTSPTKQRSSYTEVPLSDSPNNQIDGDILRTKPGSMAEAWFTADSLPSRSQNSSPKKSTKGSSYGYQAVSQPYDSSDDVSTISHQTNPLAANPVTPNRNRFPMVNQHRQSGSPLSEINSNRRTSGQDIADMSSQRQGRDNSPKLASYLKAKQYGELKPGTPPIMIGGKGNRQVSSGNDYGIGNRTGGYGVVDRREVSGKVAEEGRGGAANGRGWGTRFRKVSGL